MQQQLRTPLLKIGKYGNYCTRWYNSIAKDGKYVVDANGGTATILADVAASNGVIHAIDTVVMPK
jgi:uncharacterized surface protein with fasciclin (FAS1) repeats